jgi:cytochrome c oxidase assembly protein subunit 15
MTSLKQPYIETRANRRFRRLALNTVITLFLLIIAGGVVRSTGAGMGCPDWPKCFGSWVPPTEISQLPLDYKEIYGAKLKGEIEFNPVKTWIEYVNRLLGAFTGVMIILTLIASIPFLKSGPRRIFYYSLAAFVLVCFQGWLGSKVVSTELMPVMITLHMLLAIVIVFILIYLYAAAYYFKTHQSEEISNRSFISNLGIVVLFFSLVQIMLGTQVREIMDEVIHQLGYGARSQWIDNIGIPFYVHRSFSILITALNVYWIYQINKSTTGDSILRKFAKWCIIVIGLEIITGMVMAYFSVPAMAQPAHLTLGVLLIGLQFVTWLLSNGQRFFVSTSRGDLEKGLV